MTDRERKLEECYKLLIEKGNTFMAGNVRKALEEERKNPRPEG